jgi:hypothetical protein
MFQAGSGVSTSPRNINSLCHTGPHKVVHRLRCTASFLMSKDMGHNACTFCWIPAPGNQILDWTNINLQYQSDFIQTSILLPQYCEYSQHGVLGLATEHHLTNSTLYLNLSTHLQTGSSDKSAAKNHRPQISSSVHECTLLNCGIMCICGQLHLLQPHCIHKRKNSSSLWAESVLH